MRKRFKGLALIDRVPDELWTEVHDIVQERGIKSISKKKKCKKAEWLSKEVLQIAVKRREDKRQRINLKNIQAIPPAQLQKNKWPNQKMGQRTKQTFLQRRHTDG